MTSVDYPSTPPLLEDEQRVFDWQNEAPEIAVTPDEITPNFWQRHPVRPMIGSLVVSATGFFTFYGARSHSEVVDETIQSPMVSDISNVYHNFFELSGLVVLGTGVVVALRGLMKWVDKNNQDYELEN